MSFYRHMPIWSSYWIEKAAKSILLQQKYSSANMSMSWNMKSCMCLSFYCKSVIVLGLAILILQMWSRFCWAFNLFNWSFYLPANKTEACQLLLKITANQNFIRYNSGISILSINLVVARESIQSQIKPFLILQ